MKIEKTWGKKSFLFPIIVLLACRQIQKSITIVLATIWGQNEEKLAINFTNIFCNQKCAHYGVQSWSFLL